jgi:hypothetical protein
MQGRRAAVLALLSAVLLSGCIGEPPSSPVASIPRLLVDYTNNTTVLYLTSSLGADVRYGNLTMVLHNANLTGNLRFHETTAFALVARTNLSFFVINASADESGTFYYYNATLNIVEQPGGAASDPPDWQIFIRETADGTIQQASIPYRHILQEGKR